MKDKKVIAAIFAVLMLLGGLIVTATSHLDDDSSGSSTSGSDDGSSGRSSGSDDDGSDDSDDDSSSRSSGSDDDGSDDLDDDSSGRGRGSDDVSLPIDLSSPAVRTALSVASGTVDRVESEIEDGRLQTKVRIVREDGSRVDVRVDDATGEVARIRFDDGNEFRFDRDIAIVPTGTPASDREQIIRMALAVAPGSIERIQLEEEAGRLEWRIRAVQADGNRADIRIDDATRQFTRIQFEDGQEFRFDRDIDIALTANTSSTQALIVQKALAIVPGSIERIQLEREEGRLQWRIRAIQTDGQKVDIRIDDATRAVTRLDFEDGRQFRASEVGFLEGVGFSDMDDIMRIALSVAPGSIERVQLEPEEGKLIWRIRSLQLGGSRVDIRIDDQTQEVVRIEFEDGSEFRTDRDTDLTVIARPQDAQQDISHVVAQSLRNSRGVIERVEAETEDGRLVWKVRVNEDGQRLDLGIDDVTGRVIGSDQISTGQSGLDDSLVIAPDDSDVEQQQQERPGFFRRLLRIFGF